MYYVASPTLIQIRDWVEALITSPAIFPFDEDLNTDTQLTDGVRGFLKVLVLKS